MCAVWMPCDCVHVYASVFVHVFMCVIQVHVYVYMYVFVCVYVNVHMCFQIILTQEENWQPIWGWKQLHFRNHILLHKSQLHLVIPPFHSIFSVSRFAMCMKLFLSVIIKSAAFHFHVKSSTLFIRSLLWKLISSFYQYHGHLLAVF